ncbi:hypothetical protein CLU79DRAFT_715116 [Phycomyces nitens]|nr:hypothetical protein CLU79DRAFT_715116 [Phycomyces nitens]
MMRVFRSKGWVFPLLSVLAVLYLKLFSSSNPKQSILEIPPPTHPLSRLTQERKSLLASVLAHARIGYVANRTPDIDTPPLVVIYRCKDVECEFASNLKAISTAYLFAMVQEGAAMGFLINSPDQWEWYFEPMPRYMALSTQHTSMYRERAKPDTVYQMDMSTQVLATTDFQSQFRSKHVRILEATHWGKWTALKTNQEMKPMRDKYRIDELSESEWFWVASRLLFSPTEWLLQQLKPFETLLGGHLRWSDSLALHDPTSYIAPLVARWLRIGLRGKPILEKCFVEQISSLCGSIPKNMCHVFISSSTAADLHDLQKALRMYATVHALPDAFGLLSGTNGDQRMSYARPFLEWTILSRMDRLLGPANDEFLLTCAWAAQVHTDLVSMDNKGCNSKVLESW